MVNNMKFISNISLTIQNLQYKLHCRKLVVSKHISEILWCNSTNKQIIITRQFSDTLNTTIFLFCFIGPVTQLHVLTIQRSSSSHYNTYH